MLPLGTVIHRYVTDVVATALQQQAEPGGQFVITVTTSLGAIGLGGHISNACNKTSPWHRDGVTKDLALVEPLNPYIAQSG